jgi:SlyX protein
MSEDRLARIEAALAHQQRVIEELNEVVTAQADEIAALRGRLDALVKRFLAVEESVQPETPVDRPPHW